MMKIIKQIIYQAVYKHIDFIFKQTFSTELVCFVYLEKFNNNLFLPL